MDEALEKISGQDPCARDLARVRGLGPGRTGSPLRADCARGTRRTLAGQVLAAAPILCARDAPAKIEAKHIIGIRRMNRVRSTFIDLIRLRGYSPWTPGVPRLNSEPFRDILVSVVGLPIWTSAGKSGSEATNLPARPTEPPTGFMPDLCHSAA